MLLLPKNCSLILSVFYFLALGLQGAFVHPGILHTEDAFAVMRQKVASKNEPAYGSFLRLKKSHFSSADYKAKGAKKVIGRKGYRQGSRSDFRATYQNALMWKITGDDAHARKAMAILEDYAEHLERVDFKADGPLLVGLQGFLFVNGAEIMRTYEGMTPEKLKKIQEMFRRVFIPVCEKFYAKKPFSNGNWGAAVTKGCMGYAIFTDNEKLYQDALKFYRSGRDNGSLRYYIDGKTGQNQEAGRDQQHSQLGIACLAEAAEVAHHQGDDLYSAFDNRLLKGFEYVARYNLKGKVPYRRWKDLTGKYNRWKKISKRGKLRNIYTMAYNHYAIRKGLKMPYTSRVVRKIQPEREGIYADHPGYGSLLFLGMK